MLEEILSYRDTPSEAVYDDFEDLIFAGNALGHNILGDEDSLQELSSEKCRRFIECLYTPGNMVLFGVGDAAPNASSASPSGISEASAARLCARNAACRQCCRSLPRHALSTHIRHTP